MIQILSMKYKLKRRLRNLKSILTKRHKRLKHSLPTDLNLETTTRCNLGCIYCGREILIRNKIIDSGEMSSVLVKKIIDEFSEISRNINTPVSICPIGLGEPLLDSRFFDIVSLIRKKIPTAIIHGNTNAILLNEQNIMNIITSSLDYLVLSINVWDREDYLSLHKVDHFDLVRNNIVNLLTTLRSVRPRIIIQLLEINLNASKIDNFNEFWSQYVDPVDIGVKTFHPMKNHIRQMMSEKELDTYSKFLGKDDTKLLENRQPCYSLFGTCSINKDGYIFPCCMGLWYGSNSDVCLGNINDISIRDIYKGKSRLHELRKLHLQGRWDEIESCRTCSGGRTKGSTNIFFKVGKRWI